MLRDTIDYLLANVAVRMRDHPARIRATIALLDKHALWTPRSADAKHAAGAVRASAIQLIYDMFGDANETVWFRKYDRACGKDCARLATGLGLEQHRRVKEFWTYSRYGLARPIPS